MIYPHYRYPVEKLFTGCSLGNYYLFARFDAETNLRGIWCADDNQFFAGDLITDIVADGVPLRAATTDFYPESQQTTYSRHGVSVVKKAFLPYYLEDEADDHREEMHALVCLFRISNTSQRIVSINLLHRLVVPAVESPLFTKQPPVEILQKRFRYALFDRSCEILTQGAENEARIISSPAGWKDCEFKDLSVFFRHELTLNPGAEETIPLILAVSGDGIEQARRVVQRVESSPSTSENSAAGYRKLLARSEIVTPDPVINRGLQWAKVNSARVQHRYRIGDAFTNDPPQDIIVIRDLAWFALGSDYLTPSFSRRLLELGARYGFHEGGKLTEYLHANEPVPQKHDYHLNINDDTPLFVYALYHHAAAAGSEDTWKIYYPPMRQAAEWIISQIHDGLVRCMAEGTQVWGICGWRNMIDDYTLSGAVTEVNAECYHALSCTADTARRLGLDDDALRYSSQADLLKSSINSKLVSEKTGLYLLNTDLQGVQHHDVTGDLIFPVMFHVADARMRDRILRRLTAADFWTAFGLRTVSSRGKSYDPDFGYQLMGGIWHNLTAWTAYCIRHDNPGALVEGMKNIFRLPEVENPKKYVNVVPGEFPERMHGDTFTSRGMTLSPWMPPTYVWLAVEGLLGVNPLPQNLELSPCIPAEWSWIAVKNLLYKGSTVTAVLFEGVLYSTLPVRSSYPVKTGVLLDASPDDERLFSLCMKVDGQILLFAASDENITGSVRILSPEGIIEQKVSLKGGAAILHRIPLPAEIPQSAGRELR